MIFQGQLPCSFISTCLDIIDRKLAGANLSPRLNIAAVNQRGNVNKNNWLCQFYHNFTNKNEIGIDRYGKRNRNRYSAYETEKG